MNAEAKLANVEAQFRAVLRGETNVITCPYCRAQNRQPTEENESPDPLCCVMCADAVNAVMLKLETDFTLDAAARIADNAVRGVSLN